ncbi:MAG: terpene cyclase/mutase family protein [Planctomycetes bacterium]|nr:terpene cyclase/mutase family protein [Planctomycetota bacterium]
MVELELRPPANLPGPATAAGLPASPSAPPPGDEAPLVDLGAAFRESPPWLVSAIVHMLVMIAFGLMIVHAEKQEDLLLDAGYADDFGDPVDESFDTLQNQFEVDENALTADNVPIVDDPLAMPNVTEVAPNAVMPTGPVMQTPIGVALTGREPGMKEALLKSYGGTGKTEGAVALGLRWVASQQHRSGLWSLSGPYSDGSQTENPEAATAMALLAFQGAGFTPASDPKQEFTQVVRRGWKALLQRQKSDGRFFDDANGTHQLYTQAQCTMALCELYAMTGDAVYYDAAQRAVDYCVKIQSPQGGWRYVPNQDSDMSVTGWFVMALQSARMGGIEVPSPVFEKIEKFLDSVQRGDENGYDVGSRYAYRVRDGATLPLTAEGLLCRQYLGWPHDDPRLNAGVEYLAANLPAWDKRNVYYWYYATQVLHHMEGKPWRKWNDEMKVLLPAHQEKRGRERGSWEPKGDRWGDAGGRLYVTCLSLLTLEVYYRHLPMYRTGLFENVR